MNSLEVGEAKILLKIKAVFYTYSDRDKLEAKCIKRINISKNPPIYNAGAYIL